ncbi:MAG: phosphotransferase [Sulfuricella sp.]|nr:phosphotransferase [Sulfuricella sp.]
MGVIKKTLFRGNILGKPRHRNLFLDMEENIHIHYRDLRIELSRGEFEDIVAAFSKQSKELQAIIEEKHYQDGKLPNANQDDVRIWTESRLKHEVKYHPQRFSLEECGDGYHFHYRNYKLLIDQVEFRQIAQLFRSLDVDSPYATSYDEVLELLEDNEIDFTLGAGNLPGELLAIAVAQHHLPKVRDIFNYIGFTQELEGVERRYLGASLKVVVKPDSRSANDFKRLRGYSGTGRLVDYLSRLGVAIDPNELNRLKCQVLDLYAALAAGQTLTVETDPELWLYAHANNQVIFPYSSTPRRGKSDAEALYKAWSSLLARLQLGFVKPTKEAFAKPEQEALRRKVDETLLREVAAFGAVEKVYLMGSAMRGDMGRYQAPFVHGKMAKLGSDVDILVEIDPTREVDVPAHWHLINPEASNHCAVYHVVQIPMANGPGEWPTRHPNMEFIEHLVDAYVFFPSHGFHEEKEAFLRKFAAKLVYDRARDGVVYRSAEEERIAARLSKLHGFTRPAVEKMKVSTENAIYKVFVGERDYVLKLFKVSGNYHRSRIIEHTDYEESLMAQLMERNIATAGVVHAPHGEDATIEGFPALLFERIPGVVQQKPEYQMEKIGRALAEIHRVQMEKPLDSPQSFTFDETCMIWLPAFHDFLKKPGLDEEISKAFRGFIPLIECYDPGEKRGELYARSPFVHCHGDVTPKNVIVTEQGEACFFDFNNAFFGPRMADVLDGAFEFSLAEKYFHLADFARFDAFIASYAAHTPLTAEEREDLPRWTELMGIIKFAKEVRVMLERPQESLRRKRALAVAQYVLSR